MRVGKIFLVILLASFFFKAGAVLAFSSGEKANFYVDATYDSQSRSGVSATLRLVSEKALFYVDDDWWSKFNDYALVNAAIVNLAEEFDNTIYPELTKVYGSEWSPGIDNEKRITILVSQMKEGTGGYFNSADEFFRTQVKNSNEREMIYLNSLYLGTAGVKGYLAHEFQHLINFFQKEKLRGVVEDIWLNEARSEYALTLCGYDDPFIGSHLAKRANEFKHNPSEPLAEWENRVADYGAVDIFLQYLVSRYSDKILTAMMSSDSAGITEIDAALAKVGSQDKFIDVFTNWVIANYLNNCQVGDGQKYCYLNQTLSYDNFHVAANINSQLSSADGAVFSFSDKTEDWAGRWYQLSVPDGLNKNIAIDFASDGRGKFVLPYVLAYADNSQSVNFLGLTAAQAGSKLILNSSNSVKTLTLMPFSVLKVGNFSNDDPSYNFSFNIKLTSENSVSSPPIANQKTENNSASSQSSASNQVSVKPSYPDGSLLRAKGDYKVYVIKGNYKRWIQSSEIFSFYPHFGWQQVIEVSRQEMDWYGEAALVRAANDTKVYEINGDGTKHWLNMTAEQFSVSGRSWDMVYIINQKELSWYKAGASVMK